MAVDPRTVDAEVLSRLRAGDLAAFEELYRQHGTRIYNVAWRMLGDTTEAEDAMQEVFLLVFRKLDGFKGEAALGTWIYRLAVNLCLDRLRSRATKDDRRTASLDDEEDGPGPAATAVEAPQELAATRIDLERAIARLPEGARAAFLLHDVEGFDHREVGSILGISEGTSKSQVHKARMRLRRWLAPRLRGALEPVEGSGRP